MRARAYTLFTRAYDDARRVVIFLRVASESLQSLHWLT